MWLASLQIEGLRCLQAVQLVTHRRLNLLVGANGAGKTSVLEAIHCLASGRSFRSGQVDHLIRRGAQRFRVIAELSDTDSTQRRLGFERDSAGWRARLDGEDVLTLGELARHLAVLCFEPGSHELIAGPAEARRRLMDLALFHVEPDYLQVWRRYQRALRQRNAALRQYQASAPWAAWEGVLAESGEWLASRRVDWFARLQGHFTRALSALLPEFEGELRWRAGWDSDFSLAELLAQTRDRDRELGYTVAGPHRSDLRVALAAGQGRHEMSRGQQKLVALSLMLATAAAIRESLEWSPVMLLDDLPSELDAERQARCVDFLEGLEAQLWITGTQMPQGIDQAGRSHRLFHVEQGQLTAA